MKGPLSQKELELMHAYWRAANYLAVGQIYLMQNPLLKESLTLDHVKPRLLGHWGTSPGLNFLYVHLNRIIQKWDVNCIYITGPGHGAPAIVANVYLEGSYSELYPHITEDEKGMEKLFRQFSFPGGIPSHVAAETPGSIHEGGELGYSLAHAYGAVFDNPDLIAACVVGDGEAETGALATSWHSNKYLNAKRDGAVLPILHLNGYKIAEPTFLARIEEDELFSLFRGYGYKPYLVEGSDPEKVHQRLAQILDEVIQEIRDIQHRAREKGVEERPIWPMIIFKTPKGWTCPKEVDGVALEGTFRAHQVPLANLAEKPEHLRLLETWMQSYRPEELFDKEGRLIQELKSLAPHKERRMGANPHTNGGMLLKDLNLPDFKKYELKVDKPGTVVGESTRIMGAFIRDIMKQNPDHFRLFGPDETASNRLSAVFEVTERMLEAKIFEKDEFISREGRVMEVLSEHLCEGWLEGYLLTGRHGLFSCYEAFIHIIDSMFNQHAKWLKVCHDIPWRRPIASLTYLLTSHVWRQDHNGFSHQDPGFIDHIMNKKASIVRIYLPPDANSLLSVTDHCLRSRNYINLIVAGKQPELQWMDMDAAVKHCSAGLGIWDWASSDKGQKPDVIMACAGDVPTMEALAATEILQREFPNLKIRVINVVDLMTLQPETEHPHGLNSTDYDSFFPEDVPVIFAFHGYPAVIHRLTYKRANHAQIHVHGFQEEGTTTTPFDMAVMNGLDRFHLAEAAMDVLPALKDEAAWMRQELRDRLIEHHQYTRKYGQDMPEIRNWKWGAH